MRHPGLPNWLIYQDRIRLTSLIMSFTPDMPWVLDPKMYEAVRATGLLNDPQLAERVREQR
jgi:hypothetical protein